jgi:hypothetical protein
MESYQSLFSLKLVQPGEGSQILRCQLTAHVLDQLPTYEALSYCWGDVADKLPIVCNDFLLQIGANLKTALIHLRQKTRKGHYRLMPSASIKRIYKSEVIRSESCATYTQKQSEWSAGWAKLQTIAT